MQLEICLDQRSTRRWHVELLRRLGREGGFRVGVRWAHSVAEPLPSCVGVLIALERIAHKLPPGSRFEPVGPEDLAPFVGRGGVSPDLVLDLTGGTPLAGRTHWHLRFDGQAGEVPLLAALVAERTPTVAITDAATGEAVAVGHPGTETPHIVAAALDDVLARTVTLIMAALRSAPRAAEPDRRAASLGCGRVAAFGAKAVGRAVLHRLDRLLRRAPHWRTGWRFVDGPGLIELGAQPPSGWRELPDDGLRVYADPFPILVAGRTWMFVQDREHRTGRGVISAVPFDGEGPVGTPTPVLEGPVDLSYPFVFEHAGEVWMIPASSAARSVDLYRATRFPSGWTHEAQLVGGVEASDATAFEHGGRWWMTAAARDGGGSLSDALHLWSAPSLVGPWSAHAANPVLVDIAAARPAGRVERVGSRLVRPVQDRRGDGRAGLALAEITRLDDDVFAQRITSRIASGPLWPGQRLGTLNRAGRLESMDGSSTSSWLGRAAGVSAAPNAAAMRPEIPTGQPATNER